MYTSEDYLAAKLKGEITETVEYVEFQTIGIIGVQRIPVLTEPAPTLEEWLERMNKNARCFEPQRASNLGK